LRRRGGIGAPRLEMMPLIDVVFLLLVVFIYSMVTMVRSYVIPVDLPGFESGETRDLPTVLVVSLESDGRLTVGGEEADLEAVEEKVARLRDANPELEVLVNADAAARHGDVVRIFDRIRATGQERVLIVGRPDEER
jgi:biopolymer transport protein ExbD